MTGIFRDRGSVTRLIGMVLCEQHDECAVTRRYMSAGSLAKLSPGSAIELEDSEEMTPQLPARWPVTITAELFAWWTRR